MHVSRRSVIALTTVFASCAVSIRIVGAHQAMAESADQEMARQLVSTLPETDYYDILLRLSEISTRGSTGESFNSRWRRTSNPLIGLFFQELGYRSAAYDNCVPWCAVALAWCLKRDGRRLPPNPARSQSYLHYGTPVTEPRRGDICIFTEVDNPAEGHVGLFSGFVDGDKISVLGGNQKGDEETNCGPGFPKSYITFEDVEINAARRKTDNGLYLRAIRRPPNGAGWSWPGRGLSTLRRRPMRLNLPRPCRRHRLRHRSSPGRPRRSRVTGSRWQACRWAARTRGRGRPDGRASWRRPLAFCRTPVMWWEP